MIFGVSWPTAKFALYTLAALSLSSALGVALFLQRLQLRHVEVPLNEPPPSSLKKALARK